MADAQLEKTTININIGNTSEKFVATGEVVSFDGFLKVYLESTDDEEHAEDSSHILPALKEGDELQRREILATEKYSLAPARYTEASLVKKLEDLGIGRPSTYAPTISTIQQRQYVVKGDKTGEERTFTIDSLKGIKITQKLKKEMAGSEKGKLLPTDIGIVVNDFLMENFPNIMNYNFTADVEKKFDDIAEGKTEWTNWMKDFDKGFEPEVKEVLEARNPLFMSFAKRRDDVLRMEKTGEAPRKNTIRYNLTFINQAITITASVTLVCYIMYTVSPEVIDNFHTDYLYLTSVFVLVGLLRYIQIAVVDQKSGDPTKIILRDRITQFIVLAWLLSFLILIYIV